MVPALADVGALGAFADGMERERAGEALEIVVVFAHGSAGAEPLRLGSGRAAGGLDLDEVDHSLIVAGMECGAGRGTDGLHCARTAATALQQNQNSCTQWHAL